MHAAARMPLAPPEETLRAPSSGPARRLFRPAIEGINLALPFAVLLFVLLDWRNLYHIFGHADFVTLSFIGNVPFLNSIHVTFTFVMLIFLPELRQWAADVSDGQTARRFWLKTGACTGTLTLLFFVLNHQNSGWMWIPQVLLYTWPVYHSVWQTRGISLQYSYQFRINAGFSSTAPTFHEQIEKRLFWLFITGAWTANLLYAGLLDRWLSPPLKETLHLAALFGMLLTLGALLVNAAWPPWAAKSKKCVYLLRLLAYPFLYLNPLVAVGENLIHRGEYLFLTGKMSSASSLAPTRRRWFVVALVSISLVYGAHYTLFFYLGFPVHRPVMGIPDFWSRLGMSILYAINLTHFFVDAQLFKMAAAPTRRWVGSLLIRNP